MENQKFKTNIKCAACVEKVSTGLNALLGEGNWKVDLSDPARILEVNTSKDPQEILESLESSGYSGEKL